MGDQGTLGQLPDLFEQDLKNIIIQLGRIIGSDVEKDGEGEEVVAADVTENDEDNDTDDVHLKTGTSVEKVGPLTSVASLPPLPWSVIVVPVAPSFSPIRHQPAGDSEEILEGVPLL